MKLLTPPLFIYFLVTTGCTKNGDTGPQGPQGLQGPQGNANVKTALYTNQAFTYNTLASVYQATVSVPDITAAIVQKGSVSAFVAKANNNNVGWTALPGNFTPNVTNASIQRFFNFNYASGTATIYTNNLPGYNVDIKVVIVAGP